MVLLKKICLLMDDGDGDDEDVSLMVVLENVWELLACQWRTDIDSELNSVKFLLDDRDFPVTVESD